jgi:voltage-gated potassium channel
VLATELKMSAAAAHEVLNVRTSVAATIDSVPDLMEQYRPIFVTIEAVSFVGVTLKCLARIWVEGELPAQQHLRSRTARWRYITGIIDLLAVLPCWFAFAVPANLRVLLVLRIVRFG